MQEWWASRPPRRARGRASSPSRRQASGTARACGIERRNVEPLISQAGVEALAERIPPGLARRVVVRGVACLVGPAVLAHDGVQLAGGAKSRDRRIRRERQALAGAVVGHRRDAIAPAVRQRTRLVAAPPAC